MTLPQATPWLPHYDYWVPREFNVPRQPLHLILQTAAVEFRNRPATAYLGATLTFEQIKSKADRLAASLHARGIGKGDHLGIQLPDCPQYAIAFFAAMRLGAVAVPIPIGSPLPPLAALVTDTLAQLPVKLQIRTALPDYSATPEPHSNNFDALIANGDPYSLPLLELDPATDPALITPAATFTHSHLFARVIQHTLWHGPRLRRGDERTLTLIPDHPIDGFLFAFWNGALSILVPTRDANQIVSACKGYHPTIFTASPALYGAILRHPEVRQCGLNRVKSLHSHGAPLSPEIAEAVEQLAGMPVRPTDGLAFHTPLLSPRPASALGIPLPATDCRIDGDGLLWIRGPQVPTTESGWFPTGISATLDASGFVHPKMAPAASVPIFSSEQFMSDLIRISKDGNVGIITVDNPPVNALSPGVPEGIQDALERHIADPSVAAIVLIGAGRTFIAGADIKEFGKVVAGQSKGHNLLPLMLAMEDSPKPVVVAIHGTALGGGLEVAMGGHYRVASPSAQVGQPEVKIGLIPGAAGTQRLPRLAGVELAARMCAFGESIKAPEALAAGILDQLIEGDLLAGAVEFARQQSDRPKPRERFIRPFDPEIFPTLRAQVRKALRNQTAPLAAISAVEAATQVSFEEGCRHERELFNQCLFGPQSKALIHAFFGEREVAKVPGLSRDTSPRPVKTAGVVGAGTMGGGIAMALANAGIPVRLRETSQEALDRGLATIRRNYAVSVAKGRFPQSVMDQRLALITPQLTWEGFDEADLIIEAVFENMQLKKEIFAILDRVARPGAILATNTSTLSIDEIASATRRPEDVAGTHFFSPANVMRLLEIVRGAETAPDVLATCLQLAKTIKKVGVVVGNCRGFVGNRMIHCYLREAQFLVEEGALPEQVDNVLYDFGMAMGPFAMGDLAGLDVGWRIRKEFQHLEKPGVRQPRISDALCERGRFGQKAGVGYYRYDESRKAAIDPDLASIINAVSTSQGIERREISTEEILDRTLLALVNEGARILEEGIAARAVDIDVIYLTGYGFPAFRGGPMFYADSLGLARVLEKIEALHAVHGELWEPAPLLVHLAREGRTFNS
jgi:3-hydroxyacyl-CoA dehydrogenase